jgi:hypothetical protein
MTGMRGSILEFCLMVVGVVVVGVVVDIVDVVVVVVSDKKLVL